MKYGLSDLPSLGPLIPIRAIAYDVLANRPSPTGGMGFFFATDISTLYFDTGSWVAVGTGVAPFVFLQGVTPGVAQVGNTNITGVGIFGQVGVGMSPVRPLDVNGIGRMLLQDLGGEVFNVKAFGAVGDGVTDDTVAIQAAIDAALAVGGGRVILPSGSFSVSGSLLLYDHLGGGHTSVWLQGQGPANSRIISTSVAGDVIVMSTTGVAPVPGSKVTDLSMTNGLETTGAAIAWALGEEFLVYNVRLGGTSNALPWFGDGIVCRGAVGTDCTL